MQQRPSLSFECGFTGVKSRKLRVVLSLVVVVVGIEMGLRVAGLGDPVLLETDRTCGYLLKPNQRHFRFFVHTSINSQSMRSDEFRLKKSAGTVRIMFVGDSIVYGTTRVDQNTIFTELLHRELPSILRLPVEVLNASTNGWAIGNELGYVETHGIYDADDVVLVLNSGDLSQPMATASDVGSSLSFEAPNCALCELFSHYLKEPRRDSGTKSVDNPRQTESNLDLLDRLLRFIQNRGARMLILFVPFPRDIKPGGITLPVELSQWAQNRGVTIVDATSSLAKLTPREASIDGGTHLSAAGNRAVAMALELVATATLYTTAH